MDSTEKLWAYELAELTAFMRANPRKDEMVLDVATADAIRQARRSTENDALPFRQTSEPVTPPEIWLALQTGSSHLKKLQRRLWLALSLACIGWTLAAALALQQLAA